MDNIVTISNVKENILEFNADIEGLDTDDMQVKFIINANGMDIGFDAKHLTGTKWEVPIPALPMLERTAYPFKMDVISEGYFFEPLTGTVNIVGSHDVYLSTPKQQIGAPVEEFEEHATEEKDVVLNKTTADEIAQKIMDTLPVKDTTPILEKKQKIKNKDEYVKSILTQLPNTKKVSKEPLNDKKSKKTLNMLRKLN